PGGRILIRVEIDDDVDRLAIDSAGRKLQREGDGPAAHVHRTMHQVWWTGYPSRGGDIPNGIGNLGVENGWNAGWTGRVTTPTRRSHQDDGRSTNGESHHRRRHVPHGESGAMLSIDVAGVKHISTFDLLEGASVSAAARRAAATGSNH